MSEKDQEGKRSARERMHQERAARQARLKRNKRFLIAGSVLMTIAVTVGVGAYARTRHAKPQGPVTAPAGAIGPEGLVVTDGSADAPSTLTVYEDPRCPACGQFEKQFVTTVNQLEDQGKLRGNYHLVSFIDRHGNGSGSKNAANALACAQDAGHFRAFHDVLYKNQPPETTDPWADRAKLLDLAKQVQGLDSATFESCVGSNRYGGWVSANQQDFDKTGYSSTPTLLLNGKPIYPKNGDEKISPDSLVKWVDSANEGKTTGVTTPPPAASPTANAETSSP
ncbi:DsbA family protein [Kitasatospora kifunensis]|uniref:Protein-disulfide isomerase n=1 Tax=Kitasatospora kifunensis TaxID=58351 RepID=A0A7W7VZ46_KITKI|nr:thioredoxin domain-containing protein [Kitasatospora kifunensis]MBB4928186.1 protein-disulfide isomerase [Kitasatospora kifunensis]